MPELPDITAYISALEPRIVGQRLHQVRLASPFLLRTVQPPLNRAEGRVVRELRRIGKRIAIGRPVAGAPPDDRRPAALASCGGEAGRAE
jgi:formamidopyrimidine-DNA glycosylase